MMRWLTIGVQVGLVFGLVYLFVRLVQDERADRRWWKEQMEARRTKSRSICGRAEP